MYLWIFIVGIFFAFYNAWGIGANDCANSFATSVGSKVLTLKQAVIIASIFEFSGAVLMGAHVTDAVRKKIVDRNIFEDNPGALMYGMLCADLSSAIWLTIATYFKWPVSTTHSIIGAIIGFSLAYGGKNGIMWEKVGFIVLSWILSPVLAGIFSSIFFFLINKFIFMSKNPFKNTTRLFPIITFFTFFINTLFIIYKGSPQLELDELPLWIAIVSSLCIGIFTAILAQFLYLPYAKKKIIKEFEKDKLTIEEIEDDNCKNQEELQLQSQSESKSQSQSQSQSESKSNQNNENNLTDSKDSTEELNVRTTSYNNAICLQDNTLNEESNTDEEFVGIQYDNNKDINDNINDATKYVAKLKEMKLENEISKLHSNAHSIDEKSEKLCSWIQIITACFSSFAHGSNDVANAIAPLATIYYIYKNNEIAKKTEVPIWILVLGGLGIVLGLVTWGYKIINRMGRELTKISTSRGFIIELSAALTVIIASRSELPVSTTHCQVGSIIGCGLVGGIKNIQLKLLKNILFSWLVTLPFTGLLSATIFSYGFYSPYDPNITIT